MGEARAGRIQIQGVGKRFGNQQVLKDIDLTIDPGKVTVILGPSGSGKSTLLRTINHLEKIDSGHITIDGEYVGYRRKGDLLYELKEREILKRRIDVGFVFQNFNLFPHLTAWENVAEAPLAHKRWSKADAQAKAQELLAKVGLADKVDAYPRQLSGGQQQRVAMGRALARRPKIYLFDEPLSNLDAKLRVEMRTEMKLMHQRLKTTTVYVTHDQIEAMTLGDKVAVMKDGIIQQFGTPKEIYNDPANLFVASFIGSPPMNFVPMRLKRKEGRLVALLDSGQARCELPLGMNDAGLEDRDVILGLRPEQIVLAAGEGNGSSSIRAEVQVTEPTGPDTLVFVQLNDTKVCCRLAPDVAPQVGETLTLQFDPAKVLLFDANTGERLGTASSLPAQGHADNVAQFKGR